MKRFTTGLLFVLVLFFVLPGFATVKSDLKAKKVTPQLEEQLMQNRNFDAPAQTFKKPAVAEVLGETFYDYGTNAMMGRQIAVGAGGTQFTYMWIDPADENATRIVNYDFYEPGVGFYGPQGLETVRKGWGNIALAANSEALIVNHVPVLIYKDDGEGFYTFTSTDLSPLETYPRIDAVGNTALVTAEEGINVIPDVSDMGTRTAIDLPTPADTNMVIENAETFMVFNPTNTDHFGGIIWYADNGTDPDDQSGIYYAYTMDGGATFTIETIELDATVHTEGSDMYQYLFTNFNIGNNAMGSDGVLHAAFMGYGLKLFDPDSALHDITPAFYWNSRDKQLVELTDPIFKTSQELNDSLVATFSGNALGNAYPDVVVSNDGMTVVVLWAQPELSVDNLPVMDATGAYNCHDIYAKVSTDGGATFGEAFKLAGTDGVDDLFPNAAKNFDGTNLQFIWLQDDNAGSWVFGESGGTATWMYDNVDLSPYAIGDDAQVADGFELKQNYPNPFNPTTNIDFTLEKAGKVTLEVYNILGQKVATVLNNELMSAGSNSVVFDANELASGIYTYKLTVNGKSAVKKMVLMK